jgi:hypothetical protein
MNVLTTSLFGSSQPRKIAIGYHNLGRGLQRASQPRLVQQVEARYGQRCGHVPLEAEQVHVLVATPTREIEAQLAYLSHLIGKTITALSVEGCLTALQQAADPNALVVPYINVPETEQWIQEELGASSWGLPGNMVHRLKNKAEFHQLLSELSLEGFEAPEYTITPVAAVPQAALDLLCRIEELVSQAGVGNYRLGVMLRAAESDGHYGSCLVYEHQHCIQLVLNGDGQQAHSYPTWQQALVMAQHHLASTMNQHKESRVVISRLIDVADSPGLSVVILNGQVCSLGWNGQLQEPGGTACVGTSSYQPKNAALARLQQATEEQTVVCLEALLRRTAQLCGLDFTGLRGVANLDLMLPGPQEERLQQKRGRPPAIYLAECNPRWTNYTDALLTVLATKRQAPTIGALRTAIQEGIATVDHYPLPPTVDPQRVREELLARDEVLRQAGTRIICRMTRNPMGFIFAGQVKQAQQELIHLLAKLATTTTWAGPGARREVESRRQEEEEASREVVKTAVPELAFS